MCESKDQAYVILHRNKATIYRGPYFYDEGKREARRKLDSLTGAERKKLVLQKIPVKTATQMVDQNRGIYD